MARKDQSDDAAQAGRGTSEQASEPVEEADGYRRSRRQQLQGQQAGKETAPAKAQKTLSSYEAFMEQHWEGWLRPVSILVLLAVGYVTYQWRVLPESMAGILLSGGAVAVLIYATAWPAQELIKGRSGRVLFGVLCAVWALSAGFPTLRKAVPRQVLAETTLTEAKKTDKVTIQGGGGTGPYDLTVSGNIKPGGAQNASATYDLTVTGSGGAAETVSGELEYQVHQTRGRRGTTRNWTENHNQVSHRLPASITGRELTLGVDKVDDLLEDGLHVQVHQQGVNPWIFWIVGIFVVLAMGLCEATIGNAKDKTHLLFAATMTYVFAYRFNERATPTHMVAPALEALFVALIFGGIPGIFVGWVVRRVSGRSRLKPDKADRAKRRADATDDDE